MNWRSAMYVTSRTWLTRWEKIKMTLSFFFFFQNGQWESFDFNEHIAIFGNYDSLLCWCSSYQGHFLSKENCQDHQFLLLKTPRSVFGHCVMQNTKYSLKIKQIYLEWSKWKLRGPSKSAPLSNVLKTNN